MKIANLIVFGLIGISSTLFATVQNTFVAGTPAKASEVNDNFTNLDDRIKSLEKNAIISNCTTSSKLTYTHKSSNVGDLISIEGVDYRIVKIPLKAPRSEKVYHIKIPVKVYDTTNNSVFAYIGLGKNRSNYLTDGNIYISGYQTGCLFINASRTSQAFINFNNEFEMKYTNTVNLPILIDDNIINIYYTMEKASDSIKTVILNDEYDLTTQVDTSSWQNITDEMALKGLDNLIDYIEITEVP